MANQVDLDLEVSFSTYCYIAQFKSECETTTEDL